MNLQAQSLACGARLEDLIDQLAADPRSGRDAHQLSCPYCTAALDELDGLWEPMRVLRAQRIEPPAGLVSSVMDRIRRVAAGTWQLTVEEGGRGASRVSDWVVARVAEEAARRTIGVAVVLGRLARRPERPRHPQAGAEPVVVDLEVATWDDLPIAAVAAQVRHQVIADVRRLVGIEVNQVNVTVEDLVARSTAATAPLGPPASGPAADGPRSSSTESS